MARLENVYPVFYPNVKSNNAAMETGQLEEMTEIEKLLKQEVAV
jgi:hypothetical protein